MPTRAHLRLCVLATLAVIVMLAGCRSRDNCYKTYPADSPTDRALNPEDSKPSVEPAPTQPTAETLPPPSNPNHGPR
jgi:ABC-type uncharacterized transport system auxiliary subunit